jgi:hypothetical protein
MQSAASQQENLPGRKRSLAGLCSAKYHFVVNFDDETLFYFYRQNCL